MYQYFFDSPIGQLRIVENDGFIKEISKWDVPDARLNSEGRIIKNSETFTDAVTEKTPVLAEAEQQLKEYFAGVRKSFNLPLKPEGTAFFRLSGKSCRKFLTGKHAHTEILRSISENRRRREQWGWPITIIRSLSSFRVIVLLVRREIWSVMPVDWIRKNGC